MVQENARKLVLEIHVDTLKASKGWFFRFLTRNRLALRKKKLKKEYAQRELIKTIATKTILYKLSICTKEMLCCQTLNF